MTKFTISDKPIDNSGDICCCGNVNFRRRTARPTFAVIPATCSGHTNAYCVLVLFITILWLLLF